MANRLSRYFLFMACLLVGLVGLAGTAPSAAVPLREQYLAADNMPTVARGARGKITFTATQAPTSIVKEVTFDAPDGVIIVGIGPGRTGKMPACRLGNALPSNRATCVAESDQGRFSIRPSESLAIEFAVDGAASIGALSGVARLEQQYDGVHDTVFGINVQPTPELNNEVHRSKRQIDPVTAAITVVLALLSNAFLAWHVHTIPLVPTQVTSTYNPVAAVPYHVEGQPGEKGSRYSAIGKIAVYDVIPNPNGTLTIQRGDCSGVIVPSVGKNVIMTAAHCLMNVDPATKKVSWFQRLVFCPGMSESMKTTTVTTDNPISCPADAVYAAVIDPSTHLPKAYLNSVWADVLTGQVGGADGRVSQYDLAFVELEPNAVTHKPAEQVHGSNAIGFNMGLLADLPLAKNLGYNGGSWDLNLCARGEISNVTGAMGTSAATDPVMTLIRRDVTACNMRQGVSGGPWIMRDGIDAMVSRRPSGTVFGLNATGIVPNEVKDNPLFMWTTTAQGYIDVQYSPIFRDWAMSLYRGASGIEPSPYRYYMR